MKLVDKLSEEELTLKLIVHDLIDLGSSNLETVTKKMTLAKNWTNNKKSTFFVSLA